MSPSATAMNAGWPAIACIAFTTCTPVMPSGEVPFQSMVVVPSSLSTVEKPAP